MPSKHPRIAVTADTGLTGALERVRSTTGTDEPDATLVRRLALLGADAEVAEAAERREAVSALFAALRDGDGFELTMEEIDRIDGVG